MKTMAWKLEHRRVAALAAILGGPLLYALPILGAAAPPAPYNSPTTFATKAYIDTDMVFLSPHETPAEFSSTDLGIATSTATAVGGSAATADLSGTVHPPGPALDVTAVFGSPAGLGNTYTKAQFAEGFSVSGNVVPIPTTITITGTMTLPLLDKSVYIALYRFADVSATGLAATFPFGTIQIYDYNTSGTLSYTTNGVSFQPFTGSLSLTYNLNAADLGLIAFAEAFSTVGTVNFAGSISASFAPPPGTTLTLASGQTFGATLPIANAGMSQTVHAGGLVMLDGSASSDPLGLLPLAYAWNIVSAPPGSTATLSNPTSVHPSFTADQVGNYLVQLVVTDSAGTKSLPSTVTISTTNSPPVADAGPAQVIVQVGTTVHLDGSHSYDPDGDPITYGWSFTSIPPGSSATLTGATTATPSFVADVDGTYVAQLVVRDPWVAGAPANVTVSFNNVKPVASPGTAQTTPVGSTVTLNGSGSSNANLLPMTYQWAFVSVPTGSHASISNPTSVMPSFVADVPGTYVVQLIVSDAFLTSDPATVQIQALSGTTTVETLLKQAADSIAALDCSVFKNCRLRSRLIREIHNVITRFETRHYEHALELLEEVIERVDGCALSAAPDRDDWITSCPAQAQVYQQLEQAKAAIEKLSD